VKRDRLSHRIALSELTMPSSVEVEAAHLEVHHEPRDGCAKCWAAWQLRLFGERT